MRPKGLLPVPRSETCLEKITCPFGQVSFNSWFGLPTLFVSTPIGSQNSREEDGHSASKEAACPPLSFQCDHRTNRLGVRVEVRGQTNDLSLFGCHVDTLNPMAVGSRVRIRISHVSGVFTALGRVAHAGTKGNMGVYFTSIEPTNQLMLEKWVDEQLCRSGGNTYVRVRNR
jgi:hypothetical protein